MKLIKKIKKFIKERIIDWDDKDFGEKIHYIFNEIALVCIGITYFIISLKALHILNVPFEIKINSELMYFNINPIFLTINVGFLIMIIILLYFKLEN